MSLFRVLIFLVTLSLGGAYVCQKDVDKRLAREGYNRWVRADTNRDISGMLEGVTNDVIFFPPNAENIRGKYALYQWYSRQLITGKWPISKNLTFVGLIESNQDIIVAEHRSRMISFDYQLFLGSGIWVYRRTGNGLKLSAVIWKSDYPAQGCNSTG